MTDSRRPTAFASNRDSYRDAVNASIGFAGADVDVFAALKARDLAGMLDRQLGASATARVLDVGCGVGTTDAHLVGLVAEVHGVDIEASFLEHAAAENPDVRFQHFDGARLPYDDGVFDAAFAICVLHHVDDGAQLPLLREMSRVTRPGGVVAVYEHNPVNPLTRLVVSRCELDVAVTLLRRNQVRDLLTAAGLEPAESRYITFFPRESARLSAVERRLGRVPLGAQFVVAGRVRPTGSRP